MSEKRFEVLFYGDVINCVKDENGKEYNLHELIKLLMEQQAIINKLNDELELTANTKLYSRRELERKVDEQQATIERLERKLELKTEEVEYLKRMMVKWGMVKDE